MPQALTEGVFLLGLLALLVAGGEARAQPPPAAEECLACHSDPGLKKEVGKGRFISLFVDPAHLARSPHKELMCVQCHADVRELPHAERLQKVRCEGCHRGAREALGKSVHAIRSGRGALVSTCAACHGSHDIRPAAAVSVERCKGCHQKPVAEYRESVHWGRIARGETGAPTCRSCHGPSHGILAFRDSSSPTYHLNLPRTCAQCHADPELAKQAKIRTADVYTLYLDSIHGRALTRSGLLVAANCSDCHGNHDIRRPTDPAALVYRTNVPNTCGQCHAGVRVQYEQGIHGVEVRGGNPLAPVCTDCHTAHQIRRVEAEAWKLEIVRECGTCHAESLRTYRDTFHGQVTALGFTRTARCSDCHGAHDILPSRDPLSRVNPANLVTTCQTCHPAANINFVKYDPHADPENRARNPLLYYAARFMTWLLVGVFAFFGLHTSLWGARALVAMRRGAAPPPAPEESASGEEGDRG